LGGIETGERFVSTVLLRLSDSCAKTNIVSFARLSVGPIEMQRDVDGIDGEDLLFANPNHRLHDEDSSDFDDESTGNLSDEGDEEDNENVQKLSGSQKHEEPPDSDLE